MEVLDTESSRRAARRPGHRRHRARHARARRTSTSPTPAPTRRCCATSTSRARPGQTVAIIGSTGAGKIDAGQPRAAALRRDRRPGAGRRRRRARPRARAALVAARPGPAEGLPVLRHGRQQPAARPARRDRRARCGRRSRSPRPRDFVAALPDGLDAPVAQGGTNVSGGQRQRLAIARARDPTARDLPVRRLVLGARPRHRRPAARGAASRSPATPRS